MSIAPFCQSLLSVIKECKQMIGIACNDSNKNSIFNFYEWYHF